MRALTVDEVRQAVRGRWISRNEPIPIRGVSIDSRTAGEGDLFVAIKGDKFDGHDFLADAAAAGCVAAIVDLEHDIPEELLGKFRAGTVGTSDTRQGLMDLAAYYRSVIPATVVAVTGSNGKTTTKRMIDHILGKRLIGSCSPKSYNNEIGVPLSLLAAGGGDDYVVCEVGTSSPGEIAKLTRVVKPNIAVITNIAPAHLENFVSLEKIAAEKATLLGWLAQRDLAVVWADSPELDNALKSYQHRTIRFGDSSTAQLRLTGYECDGHTQRFQINDRDWCSLPIPGQHNAANATAAIAVCARFGFSQEDAISALEDFSGVEMRLEQIEINGIRIINDAYNANPSSCRAGVDVLVDCKAKRRVFVIGDMLELGPKTEEFHAELGRYLASLPVDAIIGVGQLGRLVAENARGEEDEKFTAMFDSTEEAAEEIGDILADGDVVLLKGSRAMGLDRLVDTIRKAKTKKKGKKQT